jgi:ferredoxin-NADP reductase
MYGKNIKLSKARGRGLNLGEITSGNILFLTGGTGINPFCDIIDLLYK